MLRGCTEGSHLEDDDVSTQFNGDVTADAELKEQAVLSSLLVELVDRTAALPDLSSAGAAEPPPPQNAEPTSAVSTKAPPRRVFELVAAAVQREPEVLLKNYLMLKVRT